MSSTSSPTLPLELSLREILGDGIVAGDGSHSVDGLTPQLVAVPSSVEELAQVLAAANDGNAAVVPWGAGRHMGLGNAPTSYDVAVATTKLDRVLEYEPTDMTVTVEAGITMERLRAVLAERGQFLPIDAPGDATVGGALAAAISGPSRHAYGLPRDWLLGCRVAHADGSVSKGGGRVVKNVAGYDMPRLAVGALGTLGVIVEATFKVAPLPAVQETFLAACPSLEAAAQAVFGADGRGLALRALAVLDAGASAGLTGGPAAAPGAPLAACWLAGPKAAVERTDQELEELVRGAEVQRLAGEESTGWWGQLGERTVAGGSVALRASLPRSAVVGFIQSLAGHAGDTGFSAATASYPTTGLVLAELGGAADVLVAAVEGARRLAEKAGGSLVVTAAPVAVKERVDVWGDIGDALSIMRRLKEQFDPRGTLNPGRYVGGL